MASQDKLFREYQELSKKLVDTFKSKTKFFSKVSPYKFKGTSHVWDGALDLLKIRRMAEGQYYIAKKDIMDQYTNLTKQAEIKMMEVTEDYIPNLFLAGFNFDKFNDFLVSIVYDYVKEVIKDKTLIIMFDVSESKVRVVTINPDGTVDYDDIEYEDSVSLGSYLIRSKKENLFIVDKMNIQFVASVLFYNYLLPDESFQIINKMIRVQNKLNVLVEEQILKRKIKYTGSILKCKIEVSNKIECMSSEKIDDGAMQKKPN